MLRYYVAESSGSRDHQDACYGYRFAQLELGSLLTGIWLDDESFIRRAIYIVIMILSWNQQYFKAL